MNYLVAVQNVYSSMAKALQALGAQGCACAEWNYTPKVMKSWELVAIRNPQ